MGMLQQSTFYFPTWRIFFQKPILKCTVLSHVLLSLIVCLHRNTTRPVSQVISSQVFSNVKLANSQTRATFRFTTQKVIIIIKISVRLTSDTYLYACSFLKMKLLKMQDVYFGVFLGELSFLSFKWLYIYHYLVSDAANSTWSTEGVTTVSVDEDEQMKVYNIVCESSHFIAFAVLVDVTGALNVSLCACSEYYNYVRSLIYRTQLQRSGLLYRWWLMLDVPSPYSFFCCLSSISWHWGNYWRTLYTTLL